MLVLIVIVFFLIIGLGYVLNFTPFFLIQAIVIIFYVMFIAAFVACGAVADIVDSFLIMLCDNVPFRVLMATITRKGTETIV